MLDFAQARTTMVDTQVRPSDVTRFPVIEAMLAIPREVFVPRSRHEVAYAGRHIPLEGGRVVMEPRTLAKMLDALAVGPRDLVLDLGCGTGYSAALLGRMAGGVVALEEEPFAPAAEAALAEAGAETVALVTGPLTGGWREQAPYDAVIISGGGVETIPEAVTAQLREGGRIVALFVDGALGTVRLGTAAAGGVTWRDQFNAHAPVLPGFVRARSFAL